MGRKSKQAGGNFPLTHHERTKKFASSEYGTVAKRVAGHSQYQLGDCALSLSTLKPIVGATSSSSYPSQQNQQKTITSEALCTPSGYLYASDAILEYLLTQTKELKERRVAWERHQAERIDTASADSEKKRKADFEASQKLLKPAATKRLRPAEQAKADLKRTSFWLADSQPDAVENQVEEPPDRPVSPHSQQPLKRKDLWPVQLQWNEDGTLLCSVSEKTLHTQQVMVYWTSNSDKANHPGKLVLKDVYDQMVAPEGACPTSGRKIKQTRLLQQTGSSFAGGGQDVHVKKYRPTIT